MGMSTRVTAFLSEENETFKKQVKVLRACIESGIKELPKETAEYFGESYVCESLIEEKLKVEIPKHNYNEDMEEGFEIIVSEIPDTVHKIRFVNSY
jgi:hypothetical protein